MLSLVCFSQQPQSKYEWMPLFDNRLPSKIFEIKTDVNFQYSIASSSNIEETENGSAEISGNRISSVSLKFPLLNKSDLKLTGSLKYTDEQFYFEDQNPLSYPLYVSLNDRNLKTLGGGVYGFFHLSRNRSFIIRSNLFLAGDFYRSDKGFSFKNLAKFSLAAGYGLKKDSHTYHGFGVYYGYSLGRPTMLPIYLFKKNFRNSMALEMMLPQSIKVWNKFSEKSFVYAQTKISGNSYTIRLNNSALENFNSLQLRQSYLNFSLGITHKLGKWIWFEGEFGYSHNLNFNVSESNFIPNQKFPKPDKKYLIESELAGSPFISVSLFLSPPQGFLEKYLK